MRILIIKTSSLGDFIHTFPALSDAATFNNSIRFDWVVEEAFVQLPSLHHTVDTVIPFALRRWRKNIWQSIWSGEVWSFLRKLRTHEYDMVIDAQGLVKSALLARLARGTQHGYNKYSIREKVASLFYRHTYAIEKDQHAITRIRKLFSSVINYSFQESSIEYGIQLPKPITSVKPSLVFLHGTAWASKRWPIEYWKQLAVLASQQNQKIVLPWGNEKEREDAQSIAAVAPKHAEVMPKSDLLSLAQTIQNAQAVVSGDTGLGHLAAAFNIPAVTLYSSTHPKRAGTLGKNQSHAVVNMPCSPCYKRVCIYSKSSYPIIPPCFETLKPGEIWRLLEKKLSLVTHVTTQSE